FAFRSDKPASAVSPGLESSVGLFGSGHGRQDGGGGQAERGQSFVLEGPPGTGKSQTITNLLARAIAAGRTVLFVAEKQAALEVVKRRLESVGLAPFALDLHGRKQSMKAIRHQLREALEARKIGRAHV